jgi:hypothetical protein
MLEHSTRQLTFRTEIIHCAVETTGRRIHLLSVVQHAEFWLTQREMKLVEQTVESSC